MLSKSMRWIWLCLLSFALELGVLYLLPAALPQPVAGVLQTGASCLFVLCWLVGAARCGWQKNRRFFLFLLLYWFVPYILAGIVYPEFVTTRFGTALFFLNSELTSGAAMRCVDLANRLLFGGAQAISYDALHAGLLLIYCCGYLLADHIAARRHF